MNIPTIITLFRIVLIPIFVFIFYLPFSWCYTASAVIFALASATDWLDGFLARRLKQESKFGAFLDPVADKLMVVVALILLVGNPHLPYISLPAAVIAGREIAISALREWMAEIGKRASVAVTFVSKVKTAFQMIAILTLLACDPLTPGFLMYAGYIMLYLAAGLTLWSMVMYIKTAWPNFDIN